MSSLNNTNPYQNNELIVEKIKSLEKKVESISNNIANNHLGNNHVGDNHLGNNHLGNNHLGNNHVGNNHLGIKPIFNNTMIVATLKGLLFFYLIIAGNYIGELFQCKVIKLLNNNIYIKHLVAIISLYFFVVLADANIYPVLKPRHIVTVTLFLYMWFLITSKVDPYTWLLQIFALFIIVVSQYYKNSEMDKVSKEKSRKINRFVSILQNLLIGVLVITTIYGFLIYLGGKKLEYKKNFSFKEFFFKLNCKGDTNVGATRLKFFSNNSERLRVLKAAFS